MDDYDSCPNCDNDTPGTRIYECDNCDFIGCSYIALAGLGASYGCYEEQVCPKCGESGYTRIGQIPRDSDDDDSDDDDDSNSDDD